MAVAAFLCAEVDGWLGDDVRAAALFKAFSGQRQDWQARLDFWKALIVKVARHLGMVVVDAQEVQQQWFLRNGVLPLCLNDVLLEMLKSGEVQRLDDLFASPTSLPKRFFWSLGRALSWALGMEESSSVVVTGKLVVSVLCKERASQLVKALRELNWKSDGVVTMQLFVKLCGMPEDTQAVLHHLVVSNQARYLFIDGEERIEGVKISLVQSSSVAPLSEMDYNMLHLYWTSEKMTQRFDALDRQVAALRESAIGSLRSRDKQAAKRYLKLMKVSAASRDKCSDYMEKIHQILEAISDAEATKKMTEAIQLGNRAIKEHHVTLEEVQLQLKELDDSISVQKEITDTIAGTSDIVDEEEVEEAYASLEAELQPRADVGTPEEETKPSPDTAQSEEEIKPPPAEAENVDELEKHFSRIALQAT